MSGGEFQIKTEPIDIKDEWQIVLDQPNVKKENEINDETKGHFVAVDLNFVKCEPIEFINSQNNMENNSLELGMRFTCDICKKSYNRKDALVRHIKSVHDGIKSVCLICDKSFTLKNALSRHIKTVHEGLKFECKVCIKTFSQSGHLKIHQSVVHEGKKYECKTCKKAFSQGGNLKMHQSVVHKGK